MSWWVEYDERLFTSVFPRPFTTLTMTGLTVWVVRLQRRVSNRKHSLAFPSLGTGSALGTVSVLGGQKGASADVVLKPAERSASECVFHHLLKEWS